MKLFILIACAAFAFGQTFVQQNYDARTYAWSRTNGSGASGDLSSPGAGKTITVTPPPKGVYGASSNHYVYISDGTGTAEAALITGGTCAATSVGMCSIVVTTANAHSGAWRVGTATAGIKEAVQSGGKYIFVPSGTVYAPVTIPAATLGSQFHIFGAGRQSTVLTVASSFPLSVDGVFVSEPGEPGPIFSDFTVQFTQPNSSDLGDYTQWPPAFYIRDSPRVEIRDVQINAAWDGIDALENTGGAVIRNLWMSAFHKGIQFDGAMDTVRIDGLHFWPFGLTSMSNAMTLFINNENILGVEVGRLDDFKLTNSLFINRKAIRFWAGADDSGSTSTVSNTSFDSFGAIAIEKGRIKFSNSYFNGFSTTDTLDQISITGGTLQIENCSFIKHSPYNRAINANLTSVGTIQISNSYFDLRYNTSPQPVATIEATANTGGARSSVIFSNNYINRTPGAYTNPIVFINNGTGSPVTLTAINNIHNDQNPSDSVPFFVVEADDTHRIFSNTHNNTVTVAPGTKALGLYQTSDTELFFPAAMDVTIPGLQP
jgi:hypothetical protein